MANLNLFHFTIVIFILSTLVQSHEELLRSRKLDETPPDLNKCGNCPCNSPCNPPASPSPPPPSPPPPPKENPPSTKYCPPPPGSGGYGGGGGSQYPPSSGGGGGNQYPPSSGGGGGSQYPPSPPYVYINGPPGNLYPVDQYSSASGRIISMGFLPFLINALVLITFW